MKRAIFAIIISLLSFVSPVYAVTDPLSVPNNKYGIHITDENDFYNAEKLVNSSGGDWGYVTFVIADTDRNVDKWQKNLDLLRGLHLIPIVRIATHPEGDIWVKPKPEDAKDWTAFLSRLYWVTKNRYIVLFNEPNHTSEWGGEINPEEYGSVLASFAASLKRASSDFFILPAGLDASAPNGTATMDEVDFLQKMIAAQPDIFSQIDGWTSHSYPNPGFRGKVTDTGRGTLETYKWEMEILKSLGQRDNFPVFITETGWPHTDGSPQSKAYYSSEELREYINEAALNIWNDLQIAAVTPFILNYQSYPFSVFSWQKPGTNAFYPYYETYRGIHKVPGKPLLNSVLGNFNGLDLQNLTFINSASGITRIPVLDPNFWRSLFYHLFKL